MSSARVPKSTTTQFTTLLSSVPSSMINPHNNSVPFSTSSVPQSDDEVLSDISGNTPSWRSAASSGDGEDNRAREAPGGGGEGQQPFRNRTTTKPSATSSCCDQHQTINRYCFHQHDGQPCRHKLEHQKCYCVTEFYEEDEVSRKNDHGKLEFGIVSRYEGSGVLKIFWTLGNEIVEQDLEAITNISELRLIDRLVAPGDLIKVHKRIGEVQEISWSAIIKLQENNSVVLDIPCERLEPLVPYFVGQKIVNDEGWIGMITRVFTEATLLLNKGKTTTIDCTFLPEDMQPYPGRKVTYTVSQYKAAGLDRIGGRKLKDMDEHETIEAFVMFLNVGSVDVKWSGRVSSVVESGNTGNPPHSSLTRNYLKKHVKVLGTPKDFDWDNHPEAVERFFSCNLKTTDDVLDGGNVERYIDNKYFGDKETGRESVADIGKKSKIMTNVDYVCRVLRFSRVVKVKWLGSGKVDKIRASIITWKHSFDKPFREIVQRKVSLIPYSTDEYGVTFQRERNDTLSVKWFSRHRSESQTELGSHHYPTFNLKYETAESVYDLEPHFSYGKITPGSVVYRSSTCKLPEPLFSIGWIRSITGSGQVLVVSMNTKAEHLLFPNEIETTGIKIDGFPGDLSGSSVGAAVLQPTPQQRSNYNSDNPAYLVLYHGLYNLQISDQLFSQNLMAIQNTKVPEHFKLLAKAPTTHTFYHQKFIPSLDGKWFKAVKRDQLNLSTVSEELATIWFKAFKDRSDLYSILVAGVQGTPYEGGLFAFDIQVGPGYPQDPPTVHCLTLFSSRETAKVKQGRYNLELDDNLKPPYKLVESIISLQSKLFTSDDAFEIPSSAASLQRSKVKNYIKPGSVKSQNMWTVIETLDLMYRNVFDPPHLWVNECLHYFKMSFERIKKKLVKMVDGAEGEEFHVQPVSEGWIDAVVARLKRIDELMGNEDDDDEEEEEEEEEQSNEGAEEEDTVHIHEIEDLSYEDLLQLSSELNATATTPSLDKIKPEAPGEVAVENIEGAVASPPPSGGDSLQETTRVSGLVAVVSTPTTTANNKSIKSVNKLGANNNSVSAVVVRTSKSSGVKKKSSIKLNTSRSSNPR